MVEACLKQCTKVFSALLEAGVVHSFRFEYDTPCVGASTECSASLGSALDELIRRFQEYRDSLPFNTQQPTPKVDPKIVQIQVDRKVINDRIEAFITRKRKEVDEWNVQEFCCSKAGEVDGDAVSRVVNQWGPMTKLMRPTTSHTQCPVKQEHSATIPEGIEERLRNMESHLKLKSGCAVPHDVYARLKQLEDRILYLEGISPDYFSTTAHMAPSAQASQSSDVSRQYEDWSMSQIESRINLLQSRLREKAEAASEPSTSSMAL
ncbi:MAP3K12-binding inhibitory protein 1-like isoform X2 [Dermacentor variabilis]|uniref:MAP3K12-binding inhibitory protein 1-like isoform X2 n=1 Tax=Dermacentor variabilis TaxID=34621 RepID=UPI003F5BC1C1